VMKSQAERLGHLGRIRVHRGRTAGRSAAAACRTALSAATWCAATSATAGRRRTTTWSAATGSRRRALREDESLIGPAILVRVAQNRDHVLVGLRNEEVAVRRKLHQPGIG